MTTGQLGEKSIFTIARAIDSPPSRELYLNQVCGSDLALRHALRLFCRFTIANTVFSNRLRRRSRRRSTCQFLSNNPAPDRSLQVAGADWRRGHGRRVPCLTTRPIRRTVSLKIIKPGMDTREVVTRFEAERQALALMDHPNIAKVFDAGATDAGRPYFAMELVKGTPITEYCDQHQLSTRERLELFVTLCHGVQHAIRKA